MNIVSEHRLLNDLAATRQIGAWVEQFAEAARLAPSVRQAIDLALVEWVTNVISYAFEDSLEHWILIRMRLAPGEACAEVEDDGREFNPLTRPPVDTSVPLEQRDVGGLGIHMITKLMDSVEHRRVEGRNILTMRKRTG